MSIHAGDPELTIAHLRACRENDGLNPRMFMSSLSIAVERRSWDEMGLSFAAFLDRAGIDEDFLYKALALPIEALPPEQERFEKTKREVAKLLTPAMAGHGELGRGVDRGSSSTSIERGTTSRYTRARLRRDRPDLAERVDRKELSANAAAIEAGFRERTLTVSAESPQKAVKRLLKHFKRDQLLRALRP